MSGFFSLPLPLVWIADKALESQIADYEADGPVATTPTHEDDFAFLDERVECPCGYKAVDLTGHECFGPSLTISSARACRPDDVPPFEVAVKCTSCGQYFLTVPDGFDEVCGRCLEHERPVGGWVARARDNDLPVFTTHSGSYAVLPR